MVAKEEITSCLPNVAGRRRSIWRAEVENGEGEESEMAGVIISPWEPQSH